MIGRNKRHACEWHASDECNRESSSVGVLFIVGDPRVGMLGRYDPKLIVELRGDGRRAVGDNQSSAGRAGARAGAR
jgi:hypothetical protein